MRIFVVFLLLVFLSCCPAIAETKSALLQDYGAWVPVSAKFPILRRLEGYVEGQTRFQKNHVHDLSEQILRVGLGYRLNRRWTVYSGYYWSGRFDEEFNHEHRLWHQITYQKRIGKLTIQNRFRAEESWRIAYLGPSVRLRNQVKLSYPIANTRWYVTAFEEPMINVNAPSDGPEPGFTQNRIFVGIGRQINRFTRWEIGYLNQYRNSRTARPDIVNNVLASQLAFDFTQPSTQSKLARKPQTKMAITPGNGTELDCAPQLVMTSLASAPELLFCHNAAQDSNLAAPLHGALRQIAQSHQHPI